MTGSPIGASSQPYPEWAGPSTSRGVDNFCPRKAGGSIADSIRVRFRPRKSLPLLHTSNLPSVALSCRRRGLYIHLEFPNLRINFQLSKDSKRQLCSGHLGLNKKCLYKHENVLEEHKTEKEFSHLFWKVREMVYALVQPEFLNQMHIS